MNDSERIRAALRAEQELALTETAFDGLRIAMVNALIGSDFDEGTKREHLYHGLRALQDVRETLKQMVKVGNDTKAIAAAAEAFARGGKA